MSTRAQRLLEAATGQIDTLAAGLAHAGQAALTRPCPGRGKLGDGTIGAVAMHTAGNYRRVAVFVRGEAGDLAAGPADLLGRLEAAKRELAVLGGLDDDALDAVPPAGGMKFADGERTLEQVVASVLKHQGHQVDALLAALSTRTG
jgi:hypothetical protein